MDNEIGCVGPPAPERHVAVVLHRQPGDLVPVRLHLGDGGGVDDVRSSAAPWAGVGGSCGGDKRARDHRRYASNGGGSAEPLHDVLLIVESEKLADAYRF